ncbi:MAG: hypothetical protein ACJASX_001514 [Limisphaerales bacterium]|jgi:hypothetical protein
MRLNRLLLAILLVLSLTPNPVSAVDWIDLGDENTTLYLTADLEVPERGKPTSLALTTSTGEERITISIETDGTLTGRLYQHTTRGPKLAANKTVPLLVHIVSHRRKPDALFILVGSTGKTLSEPGTPTGWTLINQKGNSQANLASVATRSTVGTSAFTRIRLARRFSDLGTSNAFAVGKVAVKQPSQPEPPTDLSPPDPRANPNSALMINLRTHGTDPLSIDFSNLARVPAQHTIISDVRDRAGTHVHQHAYLAWHAGRYWAMWSDGPGVPHPGVSAEAHRNLVPHHDRAGTRVSFATSEDGVTWSRPADLSGPERIAGYGWIARGLWVRDGELLALASHFHAPGYAGKGLSLEAFRWDTKGRRWVAHGRVRDDSMNNFPPKKLPTGQWLMTRRDHQRQVSVMVGGVRSFDDWEIRELASYDGKGRPEEPYWYILPDGKSLVGLIRDNGGSKRLLRTYSNDAGKTWTRITRTNFPDATSKFFTLRTSRGYYVMVSNSNPRRRDPLTLAISQDGLVYTHLFHLVGGRHVDYPHIIEHDAHLLIAFSGAKQTMEVMKVSLDAVDALIAAEE